jgi:hypothetical protein
MERFVGDDEADGLLSCAMRATVASMTGGSGFGIVDGWAKGMTMSKKLGVLIHGAGWVSGQHIRAFQNNPHTEITAVSSIPKANAERCAAAAGLDVPCLDDYEAALALPGIDIVAIGTRLSSSMRSTPSLPRVRANTS